MSNRAFRRRRGGRAVDVASKKGADIASLTLTELHDRLGAPHYTADLDTGVTRDERTGETFIVPLPPFEDSNV